MVIFANYPAMDSVPQPGEWRSVHLFLGEILRGDKESDRIQVYLHGLECVFGYSFGRKDDYVNKPPG
jgi:hypothetical protein